MGKLTISLFGSFQVTLDGASLTSFESDKVRALLAYLVVEAGQAHRRENLTLLLWPEHPEERARHSLSQALYNLRSVLQEHASERSPYLLVSPETIQFNPESDYWLDVAEFTRLVEACDRHEHLLREACQPCQERFEKAARLYREDFLAGLPIQDSAAYEEWALVSRERTQLQASRALASQAGYYERQGRLQEALLAAQRLAELEPFDDGACQQLMRLLAACGKRSEALACFEKFRATLRAELEIAPQAETKALYERIRQMRAGKAGTASHVHDLPASLSPLIGREDELAEVQQRLLDPACRLLTVLGPGGSGKSRLALEAARGLLERFAHGACQVSLSPLTSLEAVVPNVAEALGLQIKEKKSPLAQVQDYLRQKELLLLLDGCEGLLESTPLFLEMMHAAPGFKILATSRTRLNTEDEQVFPLGGLKCPSAQDLDQAASSDAVRLFTSGARRVRPGFDLDRQSLPDVVQICSDVQGMPLAILLAAAWIEVLAPAEILAEMRSSLDFLQAQWAGLPAHQRSIRATFDYSWNLLDERERQVFRGLCIFRGAITRQAAQVVGEGGASELRRLVDKSLLTPQAGEWYTVHELLRQYGLEKLNEQPDAKLEVHRRYSSYYLEKLAEWEAGLKSARQVETLALLDAKINDVRPAWELACRQADVERLSRALDGLCLFYEQSARLIEGRSLCQETISMLALSHVPAERLLLARLLAWQSLFCRLLGELGPARHALEGSQRCLDGLVDSGLDTRHAQAFVHLEAGDALVRADLPAAQHYLQAALELYRSLGDTWCTALALNRLGVNRHLAGDCVAADRLLGESLELYRVLGSAAGVSSVQRLMAYNRVRTGQPESALSLMHQSIASTQASVDRGQAAIDKCALATLMIWNGQYAGVESLLREALAVDEDLGSLYEVTFTGLALGMFLMMVGRYEDSRRQLVETFLLARGNDFQREAAACLWSQGSITLLEKSPHEARPFFLESIALYRLVGHQDELVWALSLDAFCCLLLGESGEALQRLDEGLGIALSIHGYSAALFGLATSMIWLAMQGELERALELYTLLLEQPTFANATWFQDVFGKSLASWAGQLDLGATAAAEERGSQRQLWETVAEMRIKIIEQSA